jgi:DNA-binding MarR family transcriptional regulator
LLTISVETESSTSRLPSSTSDPELAARLRLAITRMARRLRQEAGAGEEISPTMTAALATIARDGPLTPSALADKEGIQRPTATRVVAKLEDAGLVSRASDPADGRVSRVETTRAGRALLKRIRTRKNQYLAKRLGALDEHELATLAEAAAIIERLLERPPADRRTPIRAATQTATASTAPTGRSGRHAGTARRATDVAR